jgi:hypothetical protein
VNWLLFSFIAFARCATGICQLINQILLSQKNKTNKKKKKEKEKEEKKERKNIPTLAAFGPWTHVY